MDASTLLAIAAVNQSIKPVIETGAKLVDSLLGESFKVAGAMLGDHIYFYRLQRILTMAGKAKNLLDEAGVKPKQLPPGFLLPLLDSASTADDEDIHDLFAHLLASAVSDDIYQHPRFRSTISEMCADEARILAAGVAGKIDFVYCRSDITPTGLKDEVFADLSRVDLRSADRFDFYYWNLMRAGLVEEIVPIDAPQLDQWPVAITATGRYKASEVRHAHGTRHWRQLFKLTDAGTLIGQLAIKPHGDRRTD